MTKPKQGVQEIDDQSIEVNRYLDYSISTVDCHINGQASYNLDVAISPLDLMSFTKDKETIERRRQTFGYWCSSTFDNAIRFFKNNPSKTHKPIQKATTPACSTKEIIKFKPTIEWHAGTLDQIYVFDQKSTFLFLQLKKINDQKATDHPLIR